MISIIIPTYNRQKYLFECLKSILSQTFKKFEIIIVDDGSTDDTEINLQPWLKKYSNIKYIKQANRGAQVARNTGIKNASFDWICFQDSDDIWLETKLERQVQILEKNSFNKNTFIYSNCYICNESKDKKTLWELPSFTGRDCFKDLILKSSPMFQSMLVSKTLLEKINYLDENIVSWQEWDTSIRLSKHANIIHLKEPTFIYNQHKDETISKNMINYIKGYMYILNKNKNSILYFYGQEKYEKEVYLIKEQAKKENILNDVKELFKGIK